MKRFFTLISILIFILTTVNAAILVDTSHYYDVEVGSVQLRSDYDYYWDNTIDARDNDAIDVKAEIYLDYYNYYGDSYYYDWVEVYAEIEGYDNGWEFVRETPSRNVSLNYANYKTVYWYDAFFVDDRYSEYRVTVRAVNGNYYDYPSEERAYVYVNGSNADSYCSDIDIFSNSVAINENETEYTTFNVKNNSDERFYIRGATVSESENFFGASVYDYDSSIAAGDTGQVKIKVVSSEVNKDETGTATLKIRGDFARGKTCYFDDIEKNFNVKVSNDSSQNSCGDIRISASNERMEENNNETFTYTVRNYGDTDFSARADVSDNSDYFDAREEHSSTVFIGAGDSKTFEYEVESESVSSDKSGTIYIRISGNYIGGDSCSYSEIGEKRITLTIEDDYWNGNGDCSDLYLQTKSLYLNESDSERISFTLENNSNQRFYIEDIDFDESSSELEFRNENYPSSISAGNDAIVSFDARTQNVSATKNLTAYFKVQGRFENGENCSFSNTRKSFNVRINNSGSGSDSFSDCDDIDVITQTVRIDAGKTENFDFTIENDSARKFYINNISVYDNDSKIDSSSYSSPSVVYANNDATLKVRIKARDKGTATAYIEIRGQYDNGEECSASEIGRESFSVIVGSGTTTDSCADFSLDAPSIKSILGEEEIVLNINNPLNKTGTIRISGTNLSVSPHTIDILKNTEFTERIKVELLEGKESYLVYNINMEGCNLTSKTTKITSTKESFEIMDYPSRKTIGLNDSVSFTVKNNSFSSKEFKTKIEGLPSNWKINEKSITIPADSERTITLEITAENTGTYNAIISVESAGRRLEKEITLTIEEKEIKVSAETIQRILNEVELKVTIKNNSNEEITGNTIIEIPENWTMEGNTSFSVDAEKEKIISFSLKTDGKDKEQELSVEIELDDGRKIVTTAEPQKETGISTALVSLGQNIGLAVGLLVIIIIVVILLVKRQ